MTESYRDRTPPIVLRSWEDFQRSKFRTTITFSPWAPQYIAHAATIELPGEGNVEGQAETMERAIAIAVDKANKRWRIAP